MENYMKNIFFKIKNKLIIKNKLTIKKIILYVLNDQCIMLNKLL